MRRIWYVAGAFTLVAAMTAVIFLGGHQGSASAATVADEIHYTITGPTSVTFDWRGDPTSIAYGATASYGQTVTAGGPVVVKESGTSTSVTPNSNPGPFREARLTGLQPGTTYHYSIGGSPDQVFHTAPVAGSAGFSIVAEGDIGNPQDFPSMQAIQNLVAGQSPDMVLGLGDYPYVNGSPTAGGIEAFFGNAVLGAAKNGVEAWSLKAPFQMAFGNHEIDHANDNGTCTGDNLANYKALFDFPNPKEDPIYGTYCNTGGGEDWHWFDYGNTRFISFPEPWSDNWKTWNTKVDAVMAQAQADPKISFIVTFGHRPAYSSGYHPGESALANYAAALHTKYSKFVLQLNGHSHNYERTNPAATGGVTYITSGGGGGYLENGSCSNGWNSVSGSCNKPSWSAYRLMHYGILKLTFSTAGIAGQYICGPDGGETIVEACTPGSVPDSFTIGSVTTPPPDTTPPTVSLTAPGTGATLNGTVAVSANASDNTAVKQVEFFDGTTSLGVDTTAPYSVNWDTTKVANGAHTLTAVATDTAASPNRATTSAVNVTVTNGCTALPTTYGSLTTQVNVPAAGTYHVWSRIMAPDTTNNSYYFQVGSTCASNVGDAQNIPTNSWTWVDYKDGTSTTKNDVNITTAGVQNITMTGREAGVRVDRVLLLSSTCVPTGTGDNCVNPPDTNPPTNVSITAPANNASVKGQVTISATARDDVGITKVDFYDGTTLVGSSTSPSSGSAADGTWQIVWNAGNSALGSHTLTAKATDGVNTTTSPAITVTIPDVTAPAVTIMAPQNGASLHGMVNVTASATSGNPLTKAELYVNGQLKATANGVSPYSLPWDASSVTAGTYSLTVKVYDNAQPANVGTSPAVSVTVPDTTAPAAPANLNATNVAANRVDLSWQASTDNSAVTGYQVLRGGVPIANVTGTTYSDTSVSPNTTYTYSVTAFDGAGNISSASNTVTFTTPRTSDTTPPTTPANLTATARSATQVQLSWGASSDDTGVAKYVIQRSGGAAGQVVVGESTTTTYTDSTAAPDTTYDYTVYAADAANNVSPASNKASATTPSLADTTPPSTPQDVTAVNISADQINVFWQPSTDSVGVAGYYVQRNGTRVATVTGISYGDGNLTPDTRYTYTITAFDAAGNVSAAGTTSITSLPAPTPGTQNYVLNADFEASLKGWKQLESTSQLKLARVDTAHTGYNAARLTRLSGTGDITLNDSPDWLLHVPAGKKSCTASAWVQSNALGSRVVIRLRDYKNQSTRTGYYTSDIYIPDNGWHLITVSAPILTPQDDFDLNVYGKNFKPGSYLTIDDVQERCL